MIRHMLAGAAALALMTGAALAQDSSVTTTVAPAVVAPNDSYSKSTTQTSTDAYGNQVQHTDSVQKSQAMTPDGDSITTTHSQSSSGVVAPVPMGSTTTTTTTDQ